MATACTDKRRRSRMRITAARVARDIFLTKPGRGYDTPGRGLGKVCPMKTPILTRLLVPSLFFGGLLFTAGADEKPAPADQRPLVQLAVLLDTSNSMDGL